MFTVDWCQKQNCLTPHVLMNRHWQKMKLMQPVVSLYFHDASMNWILQQSEQLCKHQKTQKIVETIELKKLFKPDVNLHIRFNRMKHTKPNFLIIADALKDNWVFLNWWLHQIFIILHILNILDVSVLNSYHRCFYTRNNHQKENTERSLIETNSKVRVYQTNHVLLRFVRLRLIAWASDEIRFFWKSIKYNNRD